MKKLPDYTLIDQKATGMRLKNAIRTSGYSVSEIQQFLSLSCPQPIYRWFRGEVLPSLHHLYALSGLLDVPMDDLLVQGQPLATFFAADHASSATICTTDHASSISSCATGHASSVPSCATGHASSVPSCATGHASSVPSCATDHASSTTMSGTSDASPANRSYDPLQIDFEKTDRAGFAPGMYGIALLARLYTNKKCPEPESNQ